jgi:hypothetical protein
MIAALEKAGHKAIVVGPERPSPRRHRIAAPKRISAPICSEARRRDRRRHRDAAEFRRRARHRRHAALAGLNVPVLIQATPDTPGR